MVANAAPPSSQAVATKSAEAASTTLTAAQKREARKIENLRIGQSHTIQGSSLTVTKTSSGYSTSVGHATNVGENNTISARASFCGVALATAIIGVGAGALGVLAAVTGGGTVVIAGYILTGAQVGVLAGIATSYTAVLGWVSINIC
ncbi:hypothetical protein [Glutamicibacter ardleyensis]